MKNTPKKHHYVPRFYLRNFSERKDLNLERKNDKKNKILVIDKETKKVFQSNVYNIACENYFYSIDGVNDDKVSNLMETHLSKIEEKFSLTINKITPYWIR